MDNPSVTVNHPKEYNDYERQLFNNTKSDGGLNMTYNSKKYFVYSFGLGTIFRMKELSCFDNDLKKQIVIKGSIYIPSFCDGFDKGKDYFQKSFVDNKFQSKETIVSDIHEHYHNDWMNYEGEYFPTILSNEIVKNWGYHSGILFALDGFMKLNKTLFRSFYETKVGGSDDGELKQEEQNIFCKSMPLEIPRNHFKILTTSKNNNGELFLTETQLDNFIRTAFLGADLLPQKINMAPKGEKLLIQSVFYEFYDKYCFDYFGTNQKQAAFIRLLTDNFKGWSFEKLKGNFKPKTNKRLI
ncbi:hypothetical protein GH721_16270 [Kriegella sp. EG-1]|nr:hypothetical protein [Flavobacteriaceae bacterium EG-1]